MKKISAYFLQTIFLANAVFCLIDEKNSDYADLNLLQFQDFHKYYKLAPNLKVSILKSSEFYLENEVFSLTDSKIEVICLQQPCLLKMRNSSIFLENNILCLREITIQLLDHTTFFFRINKLSIFSLEVLILYRLITI